MKLLSSLSPAETQLLLNTSSSYKELMKFTFLDLLLKKVIEVKEIKKTATTKDKYAKKVQITKSEKCIVKGKNFDNYVPKSFELGFLSPFQKSPKIVILFKHYIKMSYQNCGGGKGYKTLIMDNCKPLNLFTMNILQQIFGGLSLTQEGKSAKDDIVAFLNQTDEIINDLLVNDQEKALDILLAIGGNIFLLKNLNFELIKQFDQSFIRIQKAKRKDFFNDDDNRIFYFDLFENAFYNSLFIDEFEYTMYSFDSDFEDAGCSSGDSGCSSCSGCSGCGGCS